MQKMMYINGVCDDEMEIYYHEEPIDALKTRNNLTPFCNNVLVYVVKRFHQRYIDEITVFKIYDIIQTYYDSVGYLEVSRIYDKIINEILGDRLQFTPFIGVLNDSYQRECVITK